MAKALQRGIFRRRGLTAPDIAGPGVVTGIQSAANSAATVVPGAVSKVQSAAGAAATSISGAIGSIIPRNCSIGTGKFCIGIAEGLTCDNLPLNLSQILPSDIVESLGNVDGTQALDEALQKVTTPYIRDCLIVGLLLMFVLTCLFIMSMYGWFSPLAGKTTLGIALSILVGLVFCVPFIIPVVILHVLQSVLGHLPSWIEVRMGDVNTLCLGALCCSVTAVILGNIIPAKYRGS